LFEERIVAGTIRLPNRPDLLSELAAARRVEQPNNRVSIRETNRRTKHLDIAEGVAACVYMIHLIKLVPKSMSLAQMYASRSGGSVVAALKNAQRPIASRLGPNSY